MMQGLQMFAAQVARLRGNLRIRELQITQCVVLPSSTAAKLGLLCCDDIGGGCKMVKSDTVLVLYSTVRTSIRGKERQFSANKTERLRIKNTRVTPLYAIFHVYPE